MTHQSNFQTKAQIAVFIEKSTSFRIVTLKGLQAEIAKGDIDTFELERNVVKLFESDADLLAAIRRSGILTDNQSIIKSAQSTPDLVAFLANLYSNKAPSPVTKWEEVQKRMALAFAGESRGKNVQKLNASLDKYEALYDGNSRYYGKIVALAQSSAVGKSFLVAQLVKKRLGVNLCFRQIGSINNGFGTAWPPQDGPICEFFQKHKNGNYMGEELAAAFFGALFHVMHAKLVQAEGTNDVIEAFNSCWKIEPDVHIEESTRYSTLELVRDKASELITKYDRNILGKAMPSPANPTSSLAWYSALFEALVEPDLRQMSAIAAAAKQPHIIISLDECTELDNLGFQHLAGYYYPQPTISLMAMRRIIKACDGYPCWFFLLDTNSAVSSLHPPSGDASPSDRLRLDYDPLPAWPYFDFDVMVHEEFAKGGPSPHDSLRLEHLKCYGRPYWSILYEAELLETASLKLFCAKVYNASEPTHVFAALSARVGINLACNLASDAIAATAVQRHMRILQSIDDNGSIMRTSAPSEPMLAIAAAHAMNKVDAYNVTIKVLVNELILKTGVVDRGSLGGLLCRLYLLMARDDVLLTRTLSVLDEYSVRTISLLDFFKALLPSVNHTDLPNDLGEYVINFTHFASVTKNIKYLTPDFLLHTWCRGAAVQCTFPQTLFDNLFIAYRKAYLSEPFDHQHCFIVAIQEKHGPEASPLELIDSITIPLAKSTGSPPSKLPHLVMLMDFGTGSSFKEGQARVQIKNQPAKPMRTSSGYYLTHEPSRMSINLRGHEEETYPFVKTLGSALSAKGLWRAISNTSGEFPEHYDELIEQMDALSRTLDEQEELVSVAGQP